MLFPNSAINRLAKISSVCAALTVSCIVSVQSTSIASVRPTFEIQESVIHSLGNWSKSNFLVEAKLAQNSYIEVVYDVPLIPQQTGMSCWAAGAAMLVFWRDQVSFDVSEVVRDNSYWSEYAHGLPIEDTSIFDVFGMIEEPSQPPYSVAEIQELLELYGPLWVTGMPGHVRVVTGLVGDGTPEGTMVLINDPWDIDMEGFDLSNQGSQYAMTFSQFTAMQQEFFQRARGRGTYTAYLAW